MPELQLGELNLHVSTPPLGDGPWPAVVVIHELFGLTDDIREHGRPARRRAATSRSRPTCTRAAARMRCLQGTFRALSAGRGQAFDDIEAARAWTGRRGPTAPAASA